MTNPDIREVALAVSRNGRPLGVLFDEHIQVDPVSGKPHIPKTALSAINRDAPKAVMECLADAPTRTLLACARVLADPAARQRLFGELAEIAALSSTIALVGIAIAEPAGSA